MTLVDQPYMSSFYITLIFYIWWPLPLLFSMTTIIEVIKYMIKKLWNEKWIILSPLFFNMTKQGIDILENDKNNCKVDYAIAGYDNNEEKYFKENWNINLKEF